MGAVKFGLCLDLSPMVFKAIMCRMVCHVCPYRQTSF